MKKFKFTTEYSVPIAIALGFFDCIHKGHRLLVNTAREYAMSNTGVESALLTFSNDPSDLLGREKQIYTFDERAEALENLHLDNLIYTDFDEDFAGIEPIAFLDKLTNTLNIKAIIVGADYTFGKHAKGNVKILNNYCQEKGIDLIIKDFAEYDGHKISTTNLKTYVKNGNIETLNSLLSEPYFMIGNIVHARHVGSKLGFPTANIQISDGKLSLASGVYATILQVDDSRYASMTNVGAKPTFDIESRSIEAYILDFDGDLYGKSVKLSYISRMRDIHKFSSPDELKTQLAFDESRVRNLIRL